MSRLSQAQQEQVFKLRTHGLTMREIAKLLGTSKDAIFRLLKSGEEKQFQAGVTPHHGDIDEVTALNHDSARRI